MTHSRIITLLVSALVALPFTACNKGEEPAQQVFEISPETLSAEALGGQVSFKITCSESWMASADKSWLKLLTVTGNGSATPVEVKVSVSENTSTQERKAQITVTTLSGIKKAIVLTQAKSSGDPTKRGISTAEQLLAFAKAVNEGGAVSPYMVDGAVTLLNDIDASSISEWIPVGTKSNPLSENFDGDGFTIKNIHWSVDAAKYPDAGFIGYARNVRIKDFTFGSEGSSVSFQGTASGTIGGILGGGESVTLTAVRNGAALSVGTGSKSLCIGGICGRIDKGSSLGDAEAKSKGCINDAAVNASFECSCAGLVGYNEGKVFNCTNNGAVSGVLSSDGKCGPAWGCSYNASSENFKSNFGYGSVNGRASVHNTAVVYPSNAYDVDLNTVDWTQDTYYDWTTVEEKQLHQGVKYSHFSCTGINRHIHVLEIDLSNPAVDLTTAYSEEQIPNPNANKNSNNGKNLRETLSEVCSRRRAEGQDIVAGVNSGFFDSNDGISRGFHIEEGEPVYVNNPAVVSGLPNHRWGITVFTDGTASCGIKALSATLEAGSSQYSICSVNDTIMRHVSAKYSVNMYTHRYHQYPHPEKKSITNPLAKNALYIIAEYKSDPVKVNTGWAEAVVTNIYDGTSSPLSNPPYLSSKKQVGFAVSGTSASELYSAAKVGSTIRIKCDMSIDGEYKPIQTQNSGMYKILDEGKDGSQSAGTSTTNTAFDPMTFPVVSKDKKTLWLVEIDGRQPEYSIGVKGYEIYRIALKLGGWNATRLDGGGSSCIWVYDKAASSGKLVNRVSDSKGERSCLNYLLVRIKN